MNKNNIDWNHLGEELLWRMVVRFKNEDSGYDIIMKSGEIGAWRLSSIIDPRSYRPLTWKQLALELGLFTEYLTPDGHDCEKCPNKEECKAFFKDDKDHEACHWWQENMKEEK